MLPVIAGNRKHEMSNPRPSRTPAHQTIEEMEGALGGQIKSPSHSSQPIPSHAIRPRRHQRACSAKSRMRKRVVVAYSHPGSSSSRTRNVAGDHRSDTDDQSITARVGGRRMSEERRRPFGQRRQTYFHATKYPDVESCFG
jgi:hypothetical protein